MPHVSRWIMVMLLFCDCAPSRSASNHKPEEPTRPPQQETEKGAQARRQRQEIVTSAPDGAEYRASISTQRKDPRRQEPSNDLETKTINCTANDEITITESFRTYAITGSCKYLTIAGNTNHVVLAAVVKGITLSGSYNKILNKGVIMGSTIVEGSYNSFVNDLYITLDEE